MLNVGVESEFEGVYNDHWESLCISRVQVGRWFFGLLPRYENWEVQSFPDSFNFVRVHGQRKYFDDSAAWRICFRGIPGPRDPCGHMSANDRRVKVTKILRCEPVR